MGAREDNARRILADPAARAQAYAYMVAVLLTHPDARRLLAEQQEAITRAMTAARERNS
jgi:hypothetical protein